MELRKILVVVDMQNDFIDGPLGNEHTKAIVDKVVDKINNFKGDMLFYTMDSHSKDYNDTQEGKNLKVPHCIYLSHGWNLNNLVATAIEYARMRLSVVYESVKPTFGSTDLILELATYISIKERFEIEFVGVCTGICVISNVMLVKSFFPEAIVTVDASCCACVTPESHKTALEAMKMCQVNIINE